MNYGQSTCSPRQSASLAAPGRRVVNAPIRRVPWNGGEDPAQQHALDDGARCGLTEPRKVYAKVLVRHELLGSRRKACPIRVSVLRQ